MNNVKYNLLLVIVIYKEKLKDSETYKSLISNYPDMPLFIYDNSPVSQHSQDEFNNNVKYVSDTSNVGLSYAYNRAAEYANEKGYKWVLLMDQDTLFCKNILEMFVAAINENPAVSIFAPIVYSGKILLSPTKNKIFSKIKKPITGLLPLSEYNVINSGMLINVDAMMSVGGYNEEVWLDYSDYEFLNRMRNKGFLNLYIINRICYQTFSEDVQTPKQKLDRYIVFCSCLKKCKKDTLRKNIFFLYQAIKRMLSLLIKTRSISPILIFKRNYLGK